MTKLNNVFFAKIIKNEIQKSNFYKYSHPSQYIVEALSAAITAVSLSE
jgi:hypothetical protein